MATPVDNTFTGASGAKIYIGPNWPAWRRAIAPSTWGLMSGNKLTDINPDRNPAINPNYPSAAPWLAGGVASFASMLGAYNSAYWDEATGLFGMDDNGGHGDYGGNEGYRQNFLLDTPAWALKYLPTGAKGTPQFALNDGQDATGLYADGRVRSTHTYNYMVYYPGVGPIIARIAAPYSGGQADVKKAFIINETTGAATLLCDYSAFNVGGGGQGTPVGGAFVDTSRNCIFTFGCSGTGVIKIDVTTGVATQVVASSFLIASQGGRAVRMPGPDLQGFFQLGGTSYPQPFYLLDPTNNYAMIQPTITGSFPAGFSITGLIGVAWDDAHSRFLMWHKQTDRTQIATLTPSGNPRTQPWVAGTLAASASNAVVPTLGDSIAINGRFFYSPGLGGCGLLNAVDQQTYFFATE